MGKKANVSGERTAVNTATGRYTRCVSDDLKRLVCGGGQRPEAGATTLNE
jgi:hypothetical protein